MVQLAKYAILVITTVRICVKLVVLTVKIVILWLRIVPNVISIIFLIMAPVSAATLAFLSVLLVWCIRNWLVRNVRLVWQYLIINVSHVIKDVFFALRKQTAQLANLSITYMHQHANLVKFHIAKSAKVQLYAATANICMLCLWIIDRFVNLVWNLVLFVVRLINVCNVYKGMNLLIQLVCNVLL